MKKGEWVVGITIFAIVVAVLFYLMFEGVSDEEEVLVEDVGGSPEVVTGNVVDWDKYNYDFVDENVKSILTSMIGNEKTAFYLPPTRYINVSRGNKFGVAFALNNPNPSGENGFEYEWTVDDSVEDSCGVSVDVGQSWIERGWRSWGKIPKGWVDHMTVYFAFPENAPLCNVKYNFEIRKDGAIYDTKQIEFNIV